ncbi:glutamine synthetase family protein [Acidisphaera rubrifaciens]|uniref:Transposase n=1 Tax=Acidisphaera rubrifaciens HS-AP3 TaxID=1231350 RepID=A0A0D6P2D0_9PROT|nr:glutamine synthetase family protein [Acidisphaera rubrifaciens]GAN75915.1 transposase [Acidisphaera rubrifaciens HS-AP3]
MDSFAARHGAWTAEQHDAAAEVAARIAEDGIGVVRFAFVDAHGVLRGKTLVAEEAVRLLDQGATATTTMVLKDLSGKTAFPVFAAGGGFPLPEMRGAADMVMLPDPSTFRVLPWAPHSGWVLCDLYLPDGRPMPLSSRGVLRAQTARLAARGLTYVAGIEIECHILAQPEGASADGRPATPHLLNPGFQYLTELRYDALDPLLERLRAALQALGLPLRTLEVEFGPSQIELTFAPATGLLPADQMILIRSAVKQTCRRHGAVATFMSRPRLPNVVSSGWHLHQSLRDASGVNVFAGTADGAGLSATGMAYLGGLLAHARAACAFTTPTINGYKRYRPLSNAPTRASWGRDNRGVMVRVLGRAGDAATRLENRAGEPAANPYLAMAAQIACGLDGIEAGRDPGPPSEAPYDDDDAPPLPRSLMEAIAALRDDACLNAAFGPAFIDYFARLKGAEIERFMAEVTEWEQAEYFDLL